MSGTPSARDLRAAATQAADLTVRSAPAVVAGHLLVMVLESAVPVATAWLTKLVLDGLTRAAPTGTVLWLVAGLAVIGVLAGAAGSSGEYLRAELGRRAGRRAMDRLFAATERFTGLGRFEDPRFLDRLRLAQQGVDSSPDFVTGVFGLGRASLTLIGFVGSLLVLSPVMTGVVLAAAVPMLVMEIRLSRRRAAVAWQVGPAERRELFYRTLLTSVDAAKEIRLFGSGRFLRQRMTAERSAVDAARRLMDLRTLRVEGTLAALAALVAGGGLVWAVLAATRGILTVGDVSMFVAAVVGVQGASRAMVSELATTHHSVLMFDHYRAVVQAGPDLPEPARPHPLPALRHGLRLRDVWFRYSDEHPWILRGVDLFVPYGATVALVGLNGAGKSTLVKLLCRLYDPQRGSITWDGVDLREVSQARLRDRISVVFQDHMNYDLTAAENIALGDIGALEDPSRIRAAAGRAGIHDTLTTLPRGYDTLLTRMFFEGAEPGSGASGVVLSGGQWQRLALARALVRDRRDLMILDEPSSGLDPMAEHEVHERVRDHRAGATSLLISHRLNTVRRADLIVVLADGRIVEQGDHDTLMAAGGGYAALFRLQSEGYREAVG
ncbi:multidrug ABC transporter permease [Actinoplanes lobatus]|uniref:ATP-binding cassette subfamily B protein n=1 Tax=Actinoplanes lobatus TaxID=113568 RepID=A0A7W7MH15_9ACTN|nr:ABC transporter ATP-binding protein [Actinoplanes lobatus]MBB4750017.1 ATP-binding cassette subfamily B protein [Actinoplanes lobatus]GGN74792.1 multidrug ABC transporter permease [Actinoplanes lobatus]GIE39093.1 multidrug ABC transporter permease [Actinoplanes lobatus]